MSAPNCVLTQQFMHQEARQGHDFRADAPWRMAA